MAQDALTYGASSLKQRTLSSGFLASFLDQAQSWRGPQPGRTPVSPAFSRRVRFPCSAFREPYRAEKQSKVDQSRNEMRESVQSRGLSNRRSWLEYDLVVPIRYEIDRHRKLIRTACIGPVNPDEISEHFRDLAADPDRPERLNVLLDLTEMVSLPETYQVRAANSELSRHRHTLQFHACAIVAGDDTVFGMMRMFLTMAEDSFSVTQVFRTKAAAELWLASNEIPGAA